VILSFFLLPSSTTARVAQNSIWVMFNLSNVYIWKNAAAFWGESGSPLALQHTWSLGVEEQFYLVFPLALSLLSRRRSLVAITVGISLASLAASIYGTAHHQVATFFLLPTRAWQPLFGVVLAMLVVPLRKNGFALQWHSPLVPELAGYAGLALVLGGFFLIPN